MKDDPVVAEIRKYKPVSLKAILRDGTERAVAVPKAGNRWERTSRTLEALPWETIECLDGTGKVLGVIEAEDESDFLADDVEGGPTMKELARVMLEVMRTTQKETRLMFEVQMKGNADLIQALIEGVRSVSDSYSLAMKVQQAHMVSGGEGGDDEVMKMMQMAMMLKAGSPPPMPPPQQPKKG